MDPSLKAELDDRRVERLARLEECEKRIRRNLKAFVEVAEAFCEIRQIAAWEKAAIERKKKAAVAPRFSLTSRGRAVRCGHETSA